jgi:hypothetical protein
MMKAAVGMLRLLTFTRYGDPMMPSAASHLHRVAVVAPVAFTSLACDAAEPDAEVTPEAGKAGTEARRHGGTSALGSPIPDPRGPTPDARFQIPDSRSAPRAMPREDVLP